MQGGTVAPFLIQIYRQTTLRDSLEKEFELFRETENLQVDDEIREMSYCRKCKKISKPKLKPKFKLFGPVIFKFGFSAIVVSKRLILLEAAQGKRL